MSITLLIPLVVAILLIGFWVSMLNDMLQNDGIPNTGTVSFRWPPESKNHWIVFFMVLSIFTAGYYYFTVYHK